MSDWQVVDMDDLAKAIAEFSALLPGWWFSLGACSVSRDASCGPDKNGPDAFLLKSEIFDHGFHADLPSGSISDALRQVTKKAAWHRSVFRAALETREAGVSSEGE